MKRFIRRYTAAAVFISMIASMLLFTGCSEAKSSYTPISGLDTSRECVLKFAIPYETDKALNTIANGFMKKYPNVEIQLQYVENYDSNAVSLVKSNSVDMILQKDMHHSEYTVKNPDGTVVKDGTTTADYFYNFSADAEIDFSYTTSAIMGNYAHIRKDGNGNEFPYQYSCPLGGETRGIFVNITLLEQYGLSVPKNYEEFIACCQKLKDNGLIPIQGAIATAAYCLSLAPAVNPIVHDADAYARLSSAEEGLSADFEDIISKLYFLAANRYIDYKTLEEAENPTFNTSVDYYQWKDFLGLRTDEKTMTVTAPENNVGYAAFFPSISSSKAKINEMISYYKLDTEITFICSPLNDAGKNSSAYITPYYGICINNKSENLIWCREFVNYLFYKDNIKLYADIAGVIPNVADAMQIVADKYGIDAEKDITLCGQILFSDSYNAFTPIGNGLQDPLKCNAQKYMIDLDHDSDGNIQYKTNEAGDEFLYLTDGKTAVLKKYVGEKDPDRQGLAFCNIQYFLDKFDGQFSKYRTE